MVSWTAAFWHFPAEGGIPVCGLGGRLPMCLAIWVFIGFPIAQGWCAGCIVGAVLLVSAGVRFVVCPPVSDAPSPDVCFTIHHY
jgi:hypothetical protein